MSGPATAMCTVPTGFASRPAARPGDAGDADAVRRAEALADAARERDGDRLRDLAVLADQLRIDARQIDLRRGGVADRAAHEVRRGAGDVGDARGQQAAGARLGGGDASRRARSASGRRPPPACRRRSRRLVAEERRAAPASRAAISASASTPRRRRRGAARSAPLRREDRQRLVAMRGVVRLQPLLDARLRHPGDLQHAPVPRPARR